MKMQETDEVQ